MENNPIEQLYAEHDIIEKTESIIEELEGKWNDDPELFTTAVKKLLSFFIEYADGYHHRKEEEILFPAIKAHPSFTLPELLEEFEMHHESFREYAQDIREDLDNSNYETAYATLTQYMSDLKDHIAAENEELFVLAEALLDAEELEQIYFRFLDIDMENGTSEKEDLEISINEMVQ